MDHNLELGNYSDFDFQTTSKWIAKHSKGKERLVVALQFSVSDIKYAPRIQYLIEKQVNCIVSKEDGSKDQCNIRFFVLSDIVNPACCLDVLNIKKSHSDLLIHFGYSCYHNIRNFRLPVYFVPSSSDYFYVSESNTLCNITSFLYKQLNNRLLEGNNSLKRMNVILSFQGILENNSQTILLDKIRSSELNKTSNDVEICIYQLSPINVTDCIQDQYSEFICDLLLTKLGHDKELKLDDLEKRFERSKNMASSESVIFFHFVSKDDKYSNLPNSFLERIFLRYNQLFEIFLCQVNNSDSSIELNPNALNELSSIISKRFVVIEKAKSIHSENRVAFVITPGITQLEWKLIEFFKRHNYRINADNGKKIKIETHIISLTGVNEVKLRNFPDIDIFCFFGCSEYFLSHIIKNLNLKTPIILTPFEYQVFLGITKWSTRYLNTPDLQSHGLNDNDLSFHSSISDSEDSELDQDFSKLLIEDSEILNNNTLSTKTESYSLQSIDKKTKKLLLSLNSIKNKYGRSYFGLNPLENPDHIPKITQGRDGIASMYKNEII
ncbi:hypothetical protein [Cryptosporidium hominis TU502]|uniref:hypothetical protein n=1 Tax=Cryptosporidium hominis (strain TU502) TaxID=353151 RepID=UPI0000452D6A|nr:hypothetical protein [Cryptosporidium hominis TU502]